MRFPSLCRIGLFSWNCCFDCTGEVAYAPAKALGIGVPATLLARADELPFPGDPAGNRAPWRSHRLQRVATSRPSRHAEPTDQRPDDDPGRKRGAQYVDRVLASALGF